MYVWELTADSSIALAAEEQYGDESTISTTSSFKISM